MTLRNPPAAFRIAPALLLLSLGAACSSDDLVKQENSGDGVIQGQVAYTGQAVVSRLGIALFDNDSNPPQSAPKKAQFVPAEPVAGGIDFPVTYKLEGVAPGTYWVMVYGDVDPDDGSPMPTAADPATEMVGPLVVAEGAGAVTQNVVLSDGTFKPPVDDVVSMDDAEPADSLSDDLADSSSSADTVQGGEVKPKPGKAALYGTVSYDGDLDGKLILVGFPNDPPASMPNLLITASDPTFPHDYQKADVDPGTYYILAYVDVNSGDGMTNAPGDPVSNGGKVVEVKLEAGDSLRKDFVLAVEE